MTDIFSLDREYVAPTYARFGIELVKGKGSLMWDSRGREYIDMGSGIAVNTLGVCDDGWISAVTEQLGTLQHASNLYYTEPCARLAAELCRRTGMKKVFFANSGAEANECAIKAARKYAAERKGAGCYKIITLKNSFHGRTLTTLAATGQEVFHRDFLPLTEGFVSVEPTAPALLEAVDENTAAVMFEPVRGEGGVLPLDEDLIRAAVKLAKERDILLIDDEVQCGNGRSGRLYAYMNYGIQPDIFTTAKGLGGGLPIGACLCAAPLAGVMSAGMHGSTFGGNPVVCAGGLYMVNTLSNPAFLAQVRETGDYLAQRLAAMPGVREVRGLGMMRGLVLEDGLSARTLAAQCLQNGLLILTAKTLLRLLPPLNISRAELDKGLSILEATLAAAV